jgi:hypothetical protein
VLEEAWLYLELSPGALMLMPSATVAHANAPIQVGEMGQLFAQRSPRGLLRYYDYGLSTEPQLFEEDEKYWRVMV